MSKKITLSGTLSVQLVDGTTITFADEADKTNAQDVLNLVKTGRPIVIREGDTIKCIPPNAILMATYESKPATIEEVEDTVCKEK